MENFNDTNIKMWCFAVQEKKRVQDLERKNKYNKGRKKKNNLSLRKVGW